MMLGGYSFCCPDAGARHHTQAKHKHKMMMMSKLASASKASSKLTFTVLRTNTKKSTTS